MGMIGLYPKFRADDRDGNPLEGGRLYSYLAGTSTPQALYADPELTQPLPQPIILDASGEALFYSTGQALKWVLTDAQDVLLWEIDPVTSSGGSGGPPGMGWGQMTVAVTPTAGAAQVAASLFPSDVLAIGLTLWIATTLGQTQGLTHVGVGTPQQPDRWGVLTDLTADCESTAGAWLSYSGLPQPASGVVTLTAYGGTFDGTGAVYLTGYWYTLRPSHEEGYSAVGGDGTTLPLPLATTATAGLIEIATAQEGTDGLRTDLAVTPAILQAKFATLPQVQAATETVAGLVTLATTAETTTGTNNTDAVTPLKLAQRLAALPTATTTSVGLVELATPTEATAGVDTTRAVTAAGLAAKVLSGTALSVVRYASGGQTVEAGSATVVVDASGRLGVGTATPNMLADVVGGDLRVFNGILRQVREAASANQIQETFSSNAGHANALTVNRYSGTFLSPAAAPPAASLYLFTFRAHDGTAVQTGATLGVTATGSFGSGDRGTTVTFATCASGSSTLAQRLSIDAQGDLALHGRSSTQDRPQAVLGHAFVNATDASRTSRLTLSVYDATSAREGLRIETSGTAPMLSFYGSAAVAKPTVTGAKGGNAALTSLLSALSTLGLITDSST